MEKVLFTVYNIILLFLFPFFFIVLFFFNLTKNKKSEGYLYKFFPAAFKPLKKTAFEEGVWIHAVSLGEMRVAVKFIDLLKSEYGKKIYLSATTKTGFDFAYNLYKQNENVLTFYFPYDFLFSLRSVLKHIKPLLFISVETEIWPNLFNILNKKNIPVALINARISEKSYKNYTRFRFFFGYIFKKIDAVLCISDIYCERFASLGIKKENMRRTGNMKFDIDASLIAEDIKEKSEILKRFIEFKTNNNSETVEAKTAKIIAAGSTHKGEEEIILDSVIKLNKTKEKNRIFLFLAPRHPERFDEVNKLLNNYLSEIELYTLSSVYASKDIKDNNSYGLSENKVVVVLVDIIGQLLTVYGVCGAAFVGGSLVSSGGHNLLEPLAFGKPVIFGRYVQNFSEAAEEIIKNSAGKQIDSPLELYEAFTDYLFKDKSADSAGKNGLNLIARNKGVSLRNLEYLHYKGYLRPAKKFG
jgi:3-deoxy-D-manno-octulosonic-acid transferase